MPFLSSWLPYPQSSPQWFPTRLRPRPKPNPRYHPNFLPLYSSPNSKPSLYPALIPIPKMLILLTACGKGLALLKCPLLLGLATQSETKRALLRERERRGKFQARPWVVLGRRRKQSLGHSPHPP